MLPRLAGSPSMTLKRTAFLLAVVAAIAAAFYLSYLWQRGGATERTQVASAGNTPAAKSAPAAGGFGGPVPVEVVAARTRALRSEVGAVGTLAANESVVLRPEIAGRVSAIAFTEGGPVRKGAVMVELDSQVARAEVAQAKAELELARANFKRTQELASQDFVSSRAQDEASSNVEVLQARYALALARLDRYQIRAPFDGVVGLRNVSVGDYVKDGADLVTLEDRSTVKVDFRLPERYAGIVNPGQPVEFTVDPLPGRVFQARVNAIDVQVDAAGRALVVRARAGNPGGQLKSGMFARVRLQLAERADAVVIPEEAVVAAATGQFVFKVVEREGRKVAQRTPVTLGIRREGVVEVIDGVAAGDLVVTAGQIRLPRDGVPVRVVDSSAPDAAPAKADAGAPGKKS
jgi:membrane fusion protein (multidrug efflux system)